MMNTKSKNLNPEDEELRDHREMRGPRETKAGG